MKNVHGKTVSKKAIMAAKTVTMIASLTGISEDKVRRLQSELQNNGERFGYCRRQGFRSRKFQPCTNAQ